MQQIRGLLNEKTKRRLDDFCFKLQDPKRLFSAGIIIAIIVGLVIATTSGIPLVYYRHLPFSAFTHSTHRRPHTLEFSPLFKMFGGGQANMGVAPFLRNPAFHDLIRKNDVQKTVIDIGVFDGEETAQAVRNGFTVFAFEPIDEHIHKILATFSRMKLSERIKFVNLTAKLIEEHDDDIQKFQQSLTKEYLLGEYPLIEVKHKEDHGFCYLFQAAASNDYSKITMKGAGVWTEMSGTALNSGNGVPSTVVTVPISDFIHHDVFWFKSDTQGRELSVLRGAVPLFQNHKVHSMTIEYWPLMIERIYGRDGIKDLLELIEQQLGLRMCFPSRIDEFRLLFGRTVGISEFITMTREVQHLVSGPKVPFYDDLTCF